MGSPFKHHLSLGNPFYLAGSLFVSCLLQGFLSANIAYFIKIVNTERPLQLFITQQKPFTILLLTFNSLVLFISVIYNFFRTINYQSNDGIRSYRDFYAFVRIIELIMVVTNIILLYGLTEQPNSFIMPLPDARALFYYGIAVAILLVIEILWNFGVIRGGISDEERDQLKSTIKTLQNDENPYINDAKIKAKQYFQNDIKIEMKYINNIEDYRKWKKYFNDNIKEYNRQLLKPGVTGEETERIKRDILYQQQKLYAIDEAFNLFSVSI